MSKAGIIKSAFIGLMENNLSLVSYLAKNGYDAAVTQTLKVGGKVEDAMYGYALAGNGVKVKGLIASASEAEREGLLGNAIKGFAAGGNLNFNNILGISGYKAYKAQRVVGMAQAGKKEEVIAQLTKYPVLFSSAVEGYATGNHGANLIKLIEGTRFYPLALYHAAKAGNKDLVNELLKKQGVEVTYIVSPLSTPGHSEENIRTFELLNHALRGYAAGHHFNEAAQLLAQGTSIAQCIGELNGVEGRVSVDLVLALLAHIRDEKTKNKVLHHIAVLGEVDKQFKLTPADLAFNQKVSECMHTMKINYIEAVVRLQANSNDHVLTEDISLSYLADVLCDVSPSADSVLTV